MSKGLLMDIAFVAGVTVVTMFVVNRIPMVGPIVRGEQKLLGVV